MSVSGTSLMVTYGGVMRAGRGTSRSSPLRGSGIRTVNPGSPPWSNVTSHEYRACVPSSKGEV